MGSRGEFGYKNQLPWGKPIKEDMKRFAKLTKEAGTVVMGANTFKSLPSKLKGRMNVCLVKFGRDTSDLRASDGGVPDLVLSYSQNLPWNSVDNRLEQMGIESYAVIGGPSIINHSLSVIDTVYLTHIMGEFEHDVKIELPEIPSSRAEVAVGKELINGEEVGVVYMKMRLGGL